MAIDEIKFVNGIMEMLETAIENDGGFPKEAATKFGEMAQPMMPALRGFFTQTAGQVGKQMNIKQRLKLTGDMAMVTTQFAKFENRMKRWKEGKVGDNANPFWDSADEDPSAEPCVE